MPLHPIAADSCVYLWHRQSHTLLETLAGHSSTINSVCWNPVNEGQFASASDDHSVRVWGTNSAAPLVIERTAKAGNDVSDAPVPGDARAPEGADAAAASAVVTSV